MKKPALIISLTLPLLSFAGYPEGFQAFNEGDYETAFKE